MATEIITKCGNGHDLTGLWLDKNDEGLYYCPRCMNDDIHEYAVCKICGKEYKLEDEPAFLDDVCEECADKAVKDWIRYLEILSDRSKYSALDLFAAEARILDSESAKILLTLVKENL